MTSKQVVEESLCYEEDSRDLKVSKSSRIYSTSISRPSLHSVAGELGVRNRIFQKGGA